MEPPSQLSGTGPALEKTILSNLYDCVLGNTAEDVNAIWQLKSIKKSKLTRITHNYLLKGASTRTVYIGECNEDFPQNPKGENVNISVNLSIDKIEEIFETKNSSTLDIIHLTNNHATKLDREVFLKLATSEDSIVLGRDFDNHHWVFGSKILILLSDVYAPAHPCDRCLSSKYGILHLDGIPTGVTQWTNEFIQAKISGLTTLREPGPLGHHYFYPNFELRNAIVSHLAKFFDTVKLHQNAFHKLIDDDRWTEWTRYKTHWIIPVGNDLPIRFFDALVSGGIPIVWEEIAHYIEALGIPKAFYVTYSAEEIFHPIRIVQRAVKIFDDYGASGIVARALYTLENFHYICLSTGAWKRTKNILLQQLCV